MEYTFQKVQLTQHEKLWLKEVYESQEFDVKKTKVKLYGKIPSDFDVGTIDARLYRYDHLTLIGIWHIDPNSKVISDVAQVVTKIKEMILCAPGIDRVAAGDLAKKLGLQEQEVEIALLLMSDLGNFRGSATGSSNNRGYTSLSFPSGDNGYDAYLSFENINNLLEDFFSPQPKVIVGNSIGAFASRLIAAQPSDMKADEIKHRKNTAFVIMPIDSSKPDLQDVLKSIKTICAKFDISAVRADEIEHQKQITDVVLQQIRDCEFLIADLSLERPNVYYEIGYAHAIGKHPILFRKKGTKLHFDLSIHNAREYENMTELEKRLESYFEEVLGRKAK